MKNRSGEKIKLASIDELLGVVNEESAMEIEISKIHPFKNHPFKVLDDEKMQDLVESVKINGVLTPVLLRMDETTENPDEYFLGTFLRRIPIRIKIPELQERSEEEKMSFIYMMFINESRLLKRKIKVTGSVLEILKNYRLAQIAVNWSTQQNFISTSMVGVRNEAEANENCAAYSWSLTDDEIKLLDRELERLGLVE